MSSIKNKITSSLKKTNLGQNLLFQAKKISGRLPVVDYNFPNSISLEIASICNLSCTHCPPHNNEYKAQTRKFGIMDMPLFYNLMDEIDKSKVCNLALHKDGEPLLHPNIVDILERMKINRQHHVYLTTNAHKLTREIGMAILQNKIDTINFSIGASSQEFYEKVRGKGFQIVIENILSFLKLRSEAEWKPRVTVQIINLPEYPEMKKEIEQFKKFWATYEVEIVIYNKLTWGVLDAEKVKIKRYPCLSLWKNFFVNSDGKVSVCCMDWTQSLIIGDANKQLIAKIWKEKEIKELRKIHIDNKEGTLDLCKTCNYWATVPRLQEYLI